MRISVLVLWLALITIAFLPAVAAANPLVSAMEADFYLTCDSPAELSCAIDFWEHAADEMADLAQTFHEFLNDPETQTWCAHQPWECQPFLEQYSVVLAALDYAVSRWEWYLSFA